MRPQLLLKISLSPFLLTPLPSLRLPQHRRMLSRRPFLLHSQSRKRRKMLLLSPSPRHLFLERQRTLRSLPSLLLRSQPRNSKRAQVHNSVDYLFFFPVRSCSVYPLPTFILFLKILLFFWAPTNSFVTNHIPLIDSFVLYLMTMHIPCYTCQDPGCR